MEEQTSSELSQIQLAEIKKAFSICDKDGNGSIDASELRDVISAITDETPTDEELQKIMLTVDKDRNGKIEWEEFYSAMVGWMQDEQKDKSPFKKKHPDKERQDVHRRIKSFFQQFKQDTEFNKIRRILAQSNASMDIDGHAELMDADGMLEDRLSSEAKLKFLYDYRATISNLQNVVNALLDPFKQLEAISCIAKLLSIVEVFKTPIERRAVADDVVRIFETVVKGSLVSVFLRLADSSPNPKIQWEALRCLTFFAPGPRIASTPEESLLHPSQMFFKKLILAENSIPVFIKLLSSPVQDVVEQTILAIGSIAAHTKDTRDYLLQHNLIAPLVAQVSVQTPLTMLRKLSWTLSILCGVTHPLNQLPQWDLISPALQSLSSMIFVNDEEVLLTVCPALSTILPGVPELVLCRRLVDLLKTNSPRIQKAVLKTITNIIKYDNIQTGMFLNNCSLLVHLRTLLKSPDNNVRMETCDCLLVLAGLKGEIQGIITAQVVNLMIALLPYDEYVRAKLIKVLKYVTRGTAIQIRHLVELGIIGALCKCLSAFKSYDKVLTHVYKYYGPTYNFELARDVLVSLDNIINIGEMEAEGSKTFNKYALAFDMEAIDKLGSLLSAIKENPNKEEVDAWRLQRPDDIPLEERVRTLLFKIKRVHSSGGSSQDKHVVAMITDMENKYFRDTQVSKTILIKTVLDEDIRVISVPRNIPFDDLKKGLEFKYNSPVLKLTYQDEEGDKITIDSQSTLEKAILRYEKSPTIKIQLTKIETPAIVVESSASANNNNNNGKNAMETAPRSFNSVPLEAPLLSPDFSANRRMKRSAPEAGENQEESLKKKLIFPVPGNAAKNFEYNLDEIHKQEIRSIFDSFGSNTTHFGPKEILELYEKWKVQAHDGEVDKDIFKQGLTSIGVTDPLVVEKYFNAFDVNKDGKINFREFVTGLSVVQRGTMEERLKFMFAAYDSDGNGVLSPNEVFDLFKATTMARGQLLRDDQLIQLVNQCFKEVDENKDGSISFDEFKKGVQTQKIVLDCFVNLVV